MLDSAQLLASLQHADSFFPAGGIAFSWGVETLVADGLLRSPQALQACVKGQLEQRWQPLDRVFLCAAYDAAEDLDALCRLDVELDAMMLARESRDGSRRAGGALLLVHERIQTPGAACYRQCVIEGTAPGHLPIAQALVWKGVGLSLEATESVSAYVMCVGMISSALRLGALGHLASQQIITRLRAEIARLLATPAPDLAGSHTFTPAAEIAMMRHEVQPGRLFAN